MQRTYPPTQTNGLSVLLLVESEDFDRGLKNALNTCGYQVTVMLITDPFLKSMQKIEPSLLVLEVDHLTSENIQSLRILSDINPLPIVVFTEFSDESMLKRLLNAKLNAYIVGDKLPHHVGPTLEVAISRFNEIQKLESELQTAKEKLEGRKWVERAKGLLMDEKKMSESQAYNVLRKMAMDRSQRIEDVAKNVITIVQTIN
ncbi:ANTAR domain-containing response regulator [Gayadomonas joobiniege]|uniref:ANTAR domain-containing response regulator n=1 Tax=Gayadomonas joobiniege TaxID=1234606 RepID=UPI000372A2AE|nr:ANTAR domain-containing protein [Gayadomonas joobiniege]